MNVLYTKERVYRSERYKDPIKELIQVLCEKVDKEEILYQAIYREVREETRLHIVSKYLTKDDRFNCDLYITDITEKELLQ